jgi:hypothetical protein
MTTPIVVIEESAMIAKSPEVQVREVHARRERHRRERAEDRGEHDRRREHRRAARPPERDQVLLREELDAVGDRLRPAVPAAGVHRAVAALDVAGDLALEPHGEHHEDRDESDEDADPDEAAVSASAHEGTPAGATFSSSVRKMFPPSIASGPSPRSRRPSSR